MHPWIEAARPKTLSAAVGPVLVGTAAARDVIVWRFAAAFTVAVAIQVAVNYANDYSDAVRGVDTRARLGPRRAVASGLIAPGRMKMGIAAALGVAAAAGGTLAAAVGPELLVIGALCFVAALAYSGGPKPYASLGLGEIFVFVFFGLVATIGSAYVQVERIVTVAVLGATPVGLLATAILVANNLRDLATDEAAGKRTLAVRLGAQRTRSLFRGLTLGGFAFLPMIAGAAESPWPMIAFVALPLAIRLESSIRAEGAGLIRALTGTARLQVVFSVLLALGLWI